MPAHPEPKSLYKFGNGEADDSPLVYANVWASEAVSGTARLTIAPHTNHVGLLKELLSVMPEPMWLLYLLVVPRGKSNAGRYQSPEPLSRENVTRFLSEFEDFLEKDGRHHLWIRAESGAAMLVYDRHNLIYAYGDVPAFVTKLMQQGLSEVQPDAITVHDPHSHHYHAAFDSQAEKILDFVQWHWTPLRDQDQR
ncbi:MAG: hypothetical protein ACRYFU_19220 [Janthinobacterium lividum]